MRASGWAVLLLLAHGGPAGPPVAAPVQASWQRALPTARGACEVHLQGRTHDAVWLLDGVRWHLAVLDPLRTPLVVLRSDGLGLALTAGGVHRVARRAPAERLLEVPELLAGRLPLRPVHALQRIGDGGVAVVQAGPGGLLEHTLLAADGRVRGRTLLADDGTVVLDAFRHGEGPLPERVVLGLGRDTLEVRCTWGPLEAPPAEAFALVAPAGLPSRDLGETGLRVLARALAVPR